jgi:hypothetical protein
MYRAWQFVEGNWLVVGDSEIDRFGFKNRQDRDLQEGIFQLPEFEGATIKPFHASGLAGVYRSPKA